MLEGWTVARGSVDYIGSLCEAADGARSIDLEGAGGPGAIEQTFATEVGTSYVVSFRYAAHPGGVFDVRRMTVSGGAEAEEVYEASAAGQTIDNVEWQRDTFVLITDSERTTLRFSVADPNGGYGMLLDQIRIVD